MNLPLLVAALLATGAPGSATADPSPAAPSADDPSHVSAPDTIVELRRGDRVVLENLSGDVTVGAWDDDRLELRGEDDEVALMVRRSGSTVRISRDDRKGRQRAEDVAIRLPSWADVEITGRSLDVRVEGMAARLDIEVVSGDVIVDDHDGPLRVRTIEGEIEISDAADGVDASSQSDDVSIRGVRGPVRVHSGSGDLEILDVRSRSVEAETQDGDIDFSGLIEDGGEYRFFVHDGDATIAIPSTSNARVAVSTFDGEFESEFPVRLERYTGGREFDFTIGDGRARIEIQVFDGEIRLLER